jgi:serine O-acetyltransferase
LQAGGFSVSLIAMDHPIDELVAQLLESYEKCGGIKHLNGAQLPSKMAVASLTQDLLQIVFPGFISDGDLTARNLVKATTEQLTDLQGRLERELVKSLEARAVPGETPLSLALSFLRQLPDLRCIVQTDVEAAFQGDPAAPNREEIVLAYPGIEAVAVFRLAHVLHTMGVAFLPRMMTEWAHSRTGIDIHPGAEIGTHFFIDHGTGVVIGGTTKIGDRVRLYQGVGLVARSLAKHVERDGQGHALGGKRHPTIGDDVTIYAGATIVGGDTVIGDRTVIGGNVWLTRSVPADAVVFFEAQQLSIHPRQRLAGDWII